MATGADKIEIENFTSPGRAYRVDRAKYQAMRDALLAVLPATSPGLGVAEAKARLLPLLPQDLFPGGDKAGWWLKAAQLDLGGQGHRAACGRQSPAAAPGLSAAAVGQDAAADRPGEAGGRGGWRVPSRCLPGVTAGGRRIFVRKFLDGRRVASIPGRAGEEFSYENSWAGGVLRCCHVPGACVARGCLGDPAHCRQANGPGGRVFAEARIFALAAPVLASPGLAVLTRLPAITHRASA